MALIASWLLLRSVWWKCLKLFEEKIKGISIWLKFGLATFFFKRSVLCYYIVVISVELCWDLLGVLFCSKQVGNFCILPVFMKKNQQIDDGWWWSLVFRSKCGVNCLLIVVAIRFIKIKIERKTNKPESIKFLVHLFRNYCLI